jgi:F420-dependent oxidoreductase-like protein
MANAFSWDAMTALAIAGQSTEHIELGTAVVPTYPRHPLVMAQQALTTQASVGGRFTLGIGLSHKVMMTGALGLAYERPARHMREYLSVLGPLLEGHPVSVRGDLYQVEASLTIGSAARVPVIVAAMGPAMLRIAGTFADGTITSWVGPKTLGDHVAPSITAAATAAGKPPPRVIAGLPIALTNEPDAAREHLATQVAFYNTLPAYKAMLDREGVDNPAAVALFGDEAAVDAALDRLAGAGATDYAAQVVSVEPGATARTLEYLASRAK